MHREKVQTSRQRTDRRTQIHTDRYVLTGEQTILWFLHNFAIGFWKKMWNSCGYQLSQYCTHSFAFQSQNGTGKSTRKNLFHSEMFMLFDNCTHTQNVCVSSQCQRLCSPQKHHHSKWSVTNLTKSKSMSIKKKSNLISCKTVLLTFHYRDPPTVVS